MSILHFRPGDTEGRSALLMFSEFLFFPLAAVGSCDPKVRCFFGLMQGGIGRVACMSSEHFGQLAWQFKRMSGSSGLKVQAAIAC
jgi:hypothetical protein